MLATKNDLHSMDFLKKNLNLSLLKYSGRVKTKKEYPVFASIFPSFLRIFKNITSFTFKKMRTVNEE